MSDRDRDEMVDVIDAVLSARMNRPDSIQGWDADEDLYPIADALIADGYRKVTVTPEQIDAAIGAGWHEYRYPRPAIDEPTDRFVNGVKAALAQFGLVPEDGEQ